VIKSSRFGEGLLSWGKKKISESGSDMEKNFSEEGRGGEEVNVKGSSMKNGYMSLVRLRERKRAKSQHLERKRTEEEKRFNYWEFWRNIFFSTKEAGVSANCKTAEQRYVYVNKKWRVKAQSEGGRGGEARCFFKGEEKSCHGERGGKSIIRRKQITVAS